MMKKLMQLLALAMAAALCLGAVSAQSTERQSLLTVKEIMNAIITPTTATIWGAYQLESDAQWQEVRNAALSVVAAGNLLQYGGAGTGEANLAEQADWQTYNQQMIDAARQVVAATESRDEEAMAAIGNDALYPPCESCHQQFQSR